MQIFDSNISSAYISVSVKVARSAHLIFCYREKFLYNWCYMISIAAFDDGRTSVIRKCPGGMPYYEPDESTCGAFAAKVTYDYV